MRNESPTLKIESDEEDFLSVVCESLRTHPRSIPPKFFYDAHGSHLFDLICETPEYYPTRTETAILDHFSADMVKLLGKDCTLIELGSGSATKTPLLLRHLSDDAQYVPIDICSPHLEQSTQRLQAMFPKLRMQPKCADYTQFDANLLEQTTQRRVVFFPGSTIGNCTPTEAVELLQQIARWVGHDGGLLIGVDCKKSPEVLNAAYNDAAGQTAAFNLNLLTRMQRELGAELDLQGFAHHAYYNSALGRVEMHLVSKRKQHIKLAGETFHFAEHETIHTENSYKYTPPEFLALARRAGWHPKMNWSDSSDKFNVHYLSLSALEPRHLPTHMS